MSFKRWSLFSVICILSMILAACTPAPAQQPAAGAQPTQVQGAANSQPAAGESTGNKVVVWVEIPDYPDLFIQEFSKFGKENGFDVEVVVPAPMDKILSALSSSNPPDLIITAGGSRARAFGYQGLIVDLRPVMEAAKFDLNDVYPSSLIQCQDRGKLVCLPWGTDTNGLYYNKDLFEEAGLDPEKPPKTMEDLMVYADKLTKKDANGNYTQIGFLPDYPWSQMGAIKAAFGGTDYAEDGTKLVANSPENVAAYQWAQQFYTKYDTDKLLKFKTGCGDYASSENCFFSGKIAMVIDGEWLPGSNFIPKFKPDLNYGVAPVPVPANKSDLYGSSIVGGTVVIMPSGSQHKDQAGKLLAYIESSQIVGEFMAKLANLPSSKKAAEMPDFKQVPNLDVFFGIMNNPKSTGIIYGPTYDEYSTDLGTAEETILHSGGDAKKLLDEIQAKHEPKLQDALKNLK